MGRKLSVLAVQSCDVSEERSDLCYSLSHTKGLKISKISKALLFL